MATADQLLGDWAHLPHDPLSFFALEEGFDRKELKRAYGRLIRRYKPETHPRQFQQIRQAYEQLDRRNRYGIRQQIVAQQTAAWEALAAAETAASEPAGHGASIERAKQGQPLPATVARSAAELGIDEPLETYKRLEAKTPKSPQEYFVLSVLSDLFHRRQSMQFLKWLLAGVKCHPADAGLRALLAEYLRVDVPTEQAAAVLAAAAGAVRGDAFYQLTEPLWERLLRERPFADFRRTLERCEQQLQHIDPHPRMVFYLRLLRPALWKADSPWLDQAIALVEKHGAGMDAALDADLELTVLIRQYQREDRVRIKDQAVRQQLDEMIQAYCTGDWQTAASTVATIQDSLARDSHGVMAAFPMNEVFGNETCRDDRLLTICLMIASDVAEQTGIDFQPASEVKLQRQASVALKDLQEGVQSVSARIGREYLRTYGLSFLGLVVAPPLLFWGAVPGGLFFGILTVWWTAALLLYFLLLKPRYLDVKAAKRVQRMALQTYETNWRPRLFRYVQSCGEADTALQLLYETARSLGADEWMSAVLSYPQADPGLLIFGRAQVFVT